MNCCYIQFQPVNNQTYIADLFLRHDLLFKNLRYRRNGLFCTDYVRFKFKRGVSQGSKTLEKRSSDFHRLCSSFVRRHSRSCGLVARVSFFCLQRGSGRLIKSNVAPKLCDHWHNFICSPVADGAKNNCDFTGFDLNGDLHNKSSHAPVKTAKKSYFAI